MLPVARCAGDSPVAAAFSCDQAMSLRSSMHEFAKDNSSVKASFGGRDTRYTAVPAKHRQRSGKIQVRSR